MQTTLPGYEIDCIKNDIRILAASRHAQYPQYNGYWDGPEWTLVCIKADIKTKLGRAFFKGELALAKLDTLEGEAVWCIYSRGNNANTMIALKKAVAVKAG